MPLIPTTPNDANTYLAPTQVIPGALLITAISKAYPMAITFTDSPGNTYRVNQLVRLNIPVTYGMQQANGLTGQIVSIDDDNFILYININSTNFDTFSVPGDGITIERPASLSPAGSRNLNYNNNTNFVAFQNLNNQGN